MKTRYALVLAVAVAVVTVTPAEAHIGTGGGPFFANATHEVALLVGHGCGTSDTYKLTVDIPAGVTAVRPMTSDFGKFTTTKDAAGLVTSVTWQKPDADLLDDDSGYYRLIIKLKTPDKPFTSLYFISHQTCKAKDGTLTLVDWNGVPGSPIPDGGKAPEPAPAIVLLPARQPGWNKYTVPAAITDLSVYFKDATIVWKGTSAYSANTVTAAQIKATGGVTALTTLNAGDEIQVKY